jgi:hypothetical protein
MSLDRGQFSVGTHGKIGLESVLDHGGVRRCNKIEVDWLAAGLG